MRPPCQPPTVLSPDFAPRSGRAAAQHVQPLGGLAAPASGPRRYHSTSTSPAASTSAATSAGSCSTKSRTLVLEPRVEVPHPVAGVQCRAPAGRRGAAAGPAPRSRPAARTPRGGSASTTRAPRAQPVVGRRAHQPAQVADLVGAVRVPAAGLGDHGRRQVEAGRVGARRRRGTPWCGRARSRPRRRGAPPASSTTRSSSHSRAAGRRPTRRTGGRRTPPPRRRTPPRTRASRASGAVREHAVAVDGRRGGDAARRGLRRSTGRAGAPSGCRAGPAGAAARAPAARPASQPAQARLDGLAVGERRAAARSCVRSAPGGCGPRSSSTVSSARSSSARSSRSSSSWWYFSVRRPVAAQTMRTSSALAEPLHDRLDLLLVVVDHRVAAAGLVAGGAQRVQRERVRRGHGDLLLQQAPSTRCSSASRTGRVCGSDHGPTLGRSQPSCVEGAQGPRAGCICAPGEAGPAHCGCDPGPDRATARRSPGPAGRRRPRAPRDRPARAGCRGRAGATRHRQDDPGAAGRRAPARTGVDADGPGVVVTQPRRIAARAAAAAAGEPARRAGRRDGRLLGARRAAGSAPRTRIEVVTTGVLLRRLQRDPELPGVAAVVLDEVHERQLDADLTLAMLLDARAALRPDLLLVAMSATVEAERTAALVGGGAPAPVVDVPGALHPVDRGLVPAAARRPPPRRARRRPRASSTTSRRACAGRWPSRTATCWCSCPGVAEVGGVVGAGCRRASTPTCGRCTAGCPPPSRTSRCAPATRRRVVRLDGGRRVVA